MWRAIHIFRPTDKSSQLEKANFKFWPFENPTGITQCRLSNAFRNIIVIIPLFYSCTSKLLNIVLISKFAL